jgi:hypothetical protein
MTWANALLLAVSLLSVVGVDAKRFDCKSRPNYITDDLGNIVTDDLGNGLTDGTRTRQCRMVVGNARFPWPAWAMPMQADKLG